MKGKIVAVLFGLPFAGVGAWMLWSIGSTVADVAAMRDWQPVPATLEDAGSRSVQSDDSTTYEAYARYRYSWAGSHYGGERVAVASGADNIGNFQQRLGNRLAAAHRAGETITVYVDPEAPANAIVDKSLRWGLLAFKGLFLLVFGGVGTGIIVFSLRRQRKREARESADAAAPWLANEDWQQATISSGSRAKMWFAGLFALFWNLVSAPMPFLAYREITESDNWLALFALLFPAVGLGLLAWAIRALREWRRFGPAPLTLDPFPGSIGGHVGGTVDLALPYDPNAAFEATLTALRSYVSGSGKNRSRRESAEWQDSRAAVAEPGGRGTRLVFRFAVPDGLAESDAIRDNDSYRLWRLSLTADLPGPDLARDYDIPVYRTARQSSKLPARLLEQADTQQAAVAASRIRERFVLEQGVTGTRIRFPVGRHLGNGLGGAVIGTVFAVAGWFIATRGGSPIFGSVFGGIGGLVGLACLYAIGNSLEVVRDGADLVSQRRWLGIPIRKRRIASHRITGIRSHSGMQSRSGGRHVIFYTLYATTDGGEEIVIGEGFRGAGEAEAASTFLAARFGLRIELPRNAAAEYFVDDPLAADI